MRKPGSTNPGEGLPYFTKAATGPNPKSSGNLAEPLPVLLWNLRLKLRNCSKNPLCLSYSGDDQCRVVKMAPLKQWSYQWAAFFLLTIIFNLCLIAKITHESALLLTIKVFG